MGSDSQHQVLDAIHGRAHKGIPIWLINPMEWGLIDRLAGMPEGSYRREPEVTYRRMLLAAGSNMIDQWIPRNPLSMGSAGYEGDCPRTATTGAECVVLDGRVIREPDDVAAHLEEVVFPRLEGELAAESPVDAAGFLQREREVQAFLGEEMLKVPYGCLRFPALHYGAYGYGPYLMAYVLYPELMERHFRLQGELAARHNAAIAGAIVREGLPPLVRLDHDMADSRGMLVRTESLDELWFPHFVRAIEPALKAGLKLIWHCDGNLMQMVPRLLEVGLHGFQGFQYEDGMDYEAICGMKNRDGDDLIIVGGVSVTRTLPYGSPAEVKRELKWLVEHGPRNRLFLGASSSIAPGVPWENLRTLAEGLSYYRHAAELS